MIPAVTRAVDDPALPWRVRITRESDRLSRLVENVLDFSRMEDGRKEYRFERHRCAVSGSTM